MPGFSPISLGGGRTVSGRAEGPDPVYDEDIKTPCKTCGVIHGRYRRGECKKPIQVVQSITQNKHRSGK